MIRRENSVRHFAPLVPGMVGALCVSSGNAAFADDKAPPSFSLSLRDTLDGWDNAAGRVTRGADVLNKLQVAATLQGDQFALDGLSTHRQIFLEGRAWIRHVDCAAVSSSVIGAG
ncbi:hypothetical protein KRR38_30060 [Novosphingobium sp. G106]|uniref:hypothetical protein n=1 Tax=Novosphingobium sp. G106 TaxID=2849500 RepID=UPI001C2D707F|nr:hypothetical protein [Novosphingobium sp. G106]MBV1686123.1 hypothetical protein [Novosphingobium sp. G106]MBV1691809.1 hypothetical protein [Novosphingobium sp. G106]